MRLIPWLHAAPHKRTLGCVTLNAGFLSMGAARSRRRTSRDARNASETADPRRWGLINTPKCSRQRVNAFSLQVKGNGVCWDDAHAEREGGMREIAHAKHIQRKWGRRSVDSHFLHYSFLLIPSALQNRSSRTCIRHAEMRVFLIIITPSTVFFFVSLFTQKV